MDGCGFGFPAATNTQTESQQLQSCQNKLVNIYVCRWGILFKCRESLCRASPSQHKRVIRNCIFTFHILHLKANTFQRSEFLNQICIFINVFFFFFLRKHVIFVWNSFSISNSHFSSDILNFFKIIFLRIDLALDFRMTQVKMPLKNIRGQKTAVIKLGVHDYLNIPRTM